MFSAFICGMVSRENILHLPFHSNGKTDNILDIPPCTVMRAGISIKEIEPFSKTVNALLSKSRSIGYLSVCKFS